MILPNYQPHGGQHPDTAAYAAALSYQGVTAPHTGQPYSEAMLLGIGGGLGMGYILWEFKAGDRKALVLGMRNNWQYPVKFLTALAERMQIPVDVLETGGAKRAQANLVTVLEQGVPPVVWTDLALMPYMMLPPELHGCYGHVVTAVGMDEARGATLIDDRAATLFTVDDGDFARARGRIPSYKNRVARLGRPGEYNLESAILAGLADCVANLGSASDSFALPAIRKWARLMTDAKHAKGWPVVFAGRRGLYDALKSVYEAVSPGGPQGGSLRDLYAEFLTEAAPIVHRPEFNEIAYHYKYINVRWSNLGEMALPTDVPALARTKELLARRQALYAALGGDGLDERRAINEELDGLDAAVAEEFPLNDRDVDALFAALQEELTGIYAAEVEAHRLLSAAGSGHFIA
jgi:hypothetical protein